jgi:hypothetical protein
MITITPRAEETVAPLAQENRLIALEGQQGRGEMGGWGPGKTRRGEGKREEGTNN